MNARNTNVIKAGSNASPEPMGNGEHPLANRHVRHHLIRQSGCEIAHPSSDATGTESPSLAREGHLPAPSTIAALHQHEAMRQDSAFRNGSISETTNAGNAAGSAADSMSARKVFQWACRTL